MKSIKNALAVSAIALCGLTGTAVAQTYTIGSNPQGTLYYTVGSALAAVLENALGTRTIVQPYTGSSVYLPLIPSGEVTIGISSALDTGRAYNDPDKPIKQLRAIAHLWTVPYGYLVRRDTGITDVDGLKGKRIARDVKAQLSLTAANTAILTAGGLNEGDYEPITIGNVLEGLALLTEGKVDATATIPGAPQSQQANATIPGGIRYLNISGPKATAATLDSISPGLTLFTVDPRPNRPSITEPVQVAGINQFLVVGADMPEAEVTKIVAAIYDNWAKLQEDIPGLRDASKDGMSEPTNAAPYHPGAVAFFKEKGIWNDANETHESGFAK